MALNILLWVVHLNIIVEATLDMVQQNMQCLTCSLVNQRDLFLYI